MVVGNVLDVAVDGRISENGDSTAVGVAAVPAIDGAGRGGAGIGAGYDVAGIDYIGRLGIDEQLHVGRYGQGTMQNPALPSSMARLHDTEHRASRHPQQLPVQ